MKIVLQKERMQKVYIAFAILVAVILLTGLQEPSSSAYRNAGFANLPTSEAKEAISDSDTSSEKEKITVIEEGIKFEIFKEGDSVKEVLKNAGFSLHEKDVVFPGRDSALKEGNKIIINWATPVNLNLYGEDKKVFTRKETVWKLLQEKQIDFGEKDLINVEFDAEIFPGRKIKIWKKPSSSLYVSDSDEDNSDREVSVTQTGWAIFYDYIPGDYCASRRFDDGTQLKVTNLSNGKSITVTVNDWGPQEWTGRIIDLERSAFSKLAPTSKGVIRVKVQKLK